MKKIYSIGILSAILATTACKPEFEDPINEQTYYSGEADFSTYVAVGNSLTAGYMDGTVFRSGQKFSFPNILAAQMKVVGGGEFTQPSFEEDINDIGGLVLGGNIIGTTRMTILMNGGQSSAVNVSGTPTIELTNLQKKAYNNMGVPGAKSFHLLATGYGNLAGLATGTANPYFVRHATSETATILGDAASQNPTFFTNWIGSNDVLFYAISGGIGVDQTGNLNVASYGPNDITDPNVFAHAYNTIINTLTTNGAKGVVATIPDVTSIPYFTTIPYNVITPERAGGETNINNLNSRLFTPLKMVLTSLGAGDRIQEYSLTGANPLLIIDETLPDLTNQIKAVASQIPQLAPFATTLGQLYGQARHATEQDLIVLRAMNIIGVVETVAPELSLLPEQYKEIFGVHGVTYPLRDQFTLTASERLSVETATNSYNNIIRTIASQKDLAVADMNAIMRNLLSGIYTGDGQRYTANYFQGQANMNTVLFSLDGIHPNARGYAFVANEVIKVINKKYKANLPRVLVANYPGIKIITSN